MSSAKTVIVTGASSGLGLAIAKAIAAGTGGSLELSSPIVGRQDGFEARFHTGKG